MVWSPERSPRRRYTSPGRRNEGHPARPRSTPRGSTGRRSSPRTQPASAWGDSNRDVRCQGPSAGCPGWVPAGRPPRHRNADEPAAIPKSRAKERLPAGSYRRNGGSSRAPDAAGGTSCKRSVSRRRRQRRGPTARLPRPAVNCYAGLWARVLSRPGVRPAWSRATAAPSIPLHPDDVGRRRVADGDQRMLML